MRRVSLQLALGFGGGIVCTLGWQRLFSAGRVDLSIVDPGALAAIAAILALAAAIACAVPARRAIRLEPMHALRHD
jgi:ABC-type antimicrobial peptide transport system permease subunit